ncbi:MAG: PaaI family thioesterase [Bacteroidia bacterium]|nr:PaaI family thioesterase [Bacteroidia bacterium]
MELLSKNPHFKQYVLGKMQLNHFMNFIGFEPTNIDQGYVEGFIQLKQHHLQQNGFVHGGVTSTLADLVMGFAAYTLVPEGQGTVTSDLKVAYLRPGVGDVIIAKGRVIKAGNLLFYCEADIIVKNPEKGEVLIARGYATMCAVKYPVKS